VDYDWFLLAALSTQNVDQLSALPRKSALPARCIAHPGDEKLARKERTP